MNGFETVELEQPSFLARLLGKKPKVNALRDIQNLLATRRLEDIAAADVEHVLSEYLLPRSDAEQDLVELYQRAVSARATNDLHLSDEHIGELRRVRYILGLNDDVARRAELDIVRSLYRTALKHALEDGYLSDAE